MTTSRERESTRLKLCSLNKGRVGMGGWVGYLDGHPVHVLYGVSSEHLRLATEWRSECGVWSRTTCSASGRDIRDETLTEQEYARYVLEKEFADR
jgi:hypothetical protein